MSPFPLDGGRVGVGGARAGFAEDGAKGFDGASRAPIADASANTPSQPSPVEGEGFSRFGRTDQVSGRMVRRAQGLRAQPTWTEAKLWDRLRQLSVRFRRQAPMGRFVVDFVCHRASLVIEVDGGVHERPDVAARDFERDAWLVSQGYAVLRFWTREVQNDIDGVVSSIRNAISNRLKKVT
ncbi:endonuclease domain-containing protein [Brevundimonas sp.]|uniref:endonuclease domain-containing protein n=1 Tax=Brevundimonas sp. TaxID=1871086 RepID=UPI00273106D0|nr:endonuclease domain-containing protein [Brevundimonas sp.]MDP1912488.1 endonuclease domain-containing protein [Brevundimonas sp.]